MTLKDIKIKDTYWSGEDDLLNDFYIPCLSNSVSYDRAVGYFSSSILKYISEGIYGIIKNNGNIRLICSPKLNQADMMKIKKGYNSREIISNNLNDIIDELIMDINLPNVNNLFWLIKSKKMDIKICLKNDNLLFHEKFGIFKDKSNNRLSFMGSINESENGWLYNEESFEVSYDWIEALKMRVENKVQRFERLWFGKAPNVTTYEFPAALRKKIIKNAPQKPINEVTYNIISESGYLIKEKPDFNFKPRKCQKDAHEKFLESNKICLYQMATGSGKTLAALNSMNKIDDWNFLLILVPTLELIEQWYEEIKMFFPNDYIIRTDMKNWKGQLIDLIEAKFPDKTIMLSTYASGRKNDTLSKFKRIPESLFAIICDEAHNLGGNETKKLIKLNPSVRIGLSATPERNFDEEGTEDILSFFNNNVYNFSISEAIRDNYLVEYEYYVYPILLKDEEWEKYKNLTKKISKLMYIEEDDELSVLNNLLIKRAKILKTAENKLNTFKTIMQSIPKENRILIYLDNKMQLQEYAAILDDINIDYFKYTGDLNPKKERPKILNEFRLGTRKILLAINCLDEGIDLPVCDSAIFVSTSTSKRQFIQRRGRVLRKSIDKNKATIYDYFVIPEISNNNKDLISAKSIIKKEYDRINLIADDAINGSETKNNLDNVLNDFGLNIYSF